ncbi:coiled-coil domain-containing protein 87 [Apteryx rowi]|uniref:coiled-coil domain-containing protein 87 n=1 Tax=Apteryx rowi TaxID=308060 RepID=UPI000E1D9B22|nr:coiled-coil domain-containing protein 87 [Apteryx rowi]
MAQASGAEAAGGGTRWPEEPGCPGPTSLPALTRLLEQHLAPARQPEEPCVRRAFWEIILAAATRAWEAASGNPHDPARGGEIRQRLLSYLVLASEWLFLHYLRLMRSSRRRGIFSEQANLTRFCAQLALDCAAYFDVAAVRRQLVAEMRSPVARGLQSSKSGRGAARGCWLGVTVGRLLRLTRPPAPSSQEKLAMDIRELESIPSPDLSRVPRWLSGGRTRFPLSALRELRCEAIRTPCPQPSGTDSRPGAEWPKAGSRSLPDLREGRRLLDELGLPRPPWRLSPVVLARSREPEEAGSRPAALAVAEDLRRLTQRAARRDLSEDPRLPPLLAVLTQLRQEELAPTPQPTRPRPPAMPWPGPRAKVAALQVPVRAFMDAVTLRGFPPLCSDLLGDPHAALADALDAGLCPGREVREVYAELAKNLPSEWLRFDREPLVQPSATDRDLCRSSASATLPEARRELVINAELSKTLPVAQRSSEAPTAPALAPRNVPWKQRGSWHWWWKTAFGFDDYLKFVSTTETDYLHVIFHLCGRAGEEEEEEEEEEPAVCQEQEQRERELTPQAAEQRAPRGGSGTERFVPGLWKPEEPGPPEETRALQKRLERLWAVLHVSGREKLAMAIKYSCGAGYVRLPAALDAWEAAASRIQERELLLARLEALEESASDPNRFFERKLGSGRSRAGEARARRCLHAAIARRDAALSAALRTIGATFGDTVTFKGRPYLEKMRWDKVEMLYWLQQRRRAGLLGAEQAGGLPPLGGRAPASLAGGSRR